MKRDYTLYLGIGVLFVAALVLAIPFFNRLANPITYDIPAQPNGQVPPSLMPTLLPSGIISGTNIISSTNVISGTNIISPTATVSAPAATPAATVAPTETISPTGALSPTVKVAVGLINPRGFTKGPDGAWYVAEAGTVSATISSTVSISATGTISPTGSISTTAPSAVTPPARATVNPICESQLPSYDKLAAGCPGAVGPQTSFNGRISRIAPDGTRTTVVDHLPAVLGPFNDVFGVNAVAFVGNDLYVIIAAGPTRGIPEYPTGVYRVANDTLTLVADLEAWQKANPPKFIPPDYNYCLPYDMIALNDKLYITDGNAAVVFEVDPAGADPSNIQRIVDLSPTHNVLTGIVTDASGTIYFTEFTPAPYPVGGAQIFKWNAQDGLSTVTKGLSIATGIALAPDGTMYAAEFADDLGADPYIAPPGRVVKISTDGTVVPVATPLLYPTALRWIDGALYVTNNGVNAVDGEPGMGEILEINEQ